MKALAAARVRRLRGALIDELARQIRTPFFARSFLPRKLDSLSPFLYHCLAPLRSCLAGRDWLTTATRISTAAPSLG